MTRETERQAKQILTTTIKARKRRKGNTTAIVATGSTGDATTIEAIKARLANKQKIPIPAVGFKDDSTEVKLITKEILKQERKKGGQAPKEEDYAPSWLYVFVPYACLQGLIHVKAGYTDEATCEDRFGHYEFSLKVGSFFKIFCRHRHSTNKIYVNNDPSPNSYSARSKPTSRRP